MPGATLTVTPSPSIDPAVGATISHEKSTAVEVTITGSKPGQSAVITVQPNTPYTWMPPAGWSAATFTANGFEQEYRTIEQEAEA